MALKLPDELIPLHIRKLIPSAKAILIAGPESKIRQAVYQYVKKSMQGQAPQGNIMEKSLIASDTPAAEVLTLLRQTPLFSPVTLIRILEVDRWNTTSWTTLINGISTHAGRNKLIMETAKEPSSIKNIKEKTLTEHGILTIQATPLKPANLASVIQTTLRHNNLSITTEALELLTALAGGSPDLALNELEKILIATDGISTITREHLLIYGGLSPSYNYFTLMDALAHRNPHLIKAILAYMDEHPHEAPLPLILAHIYRFFARLHTFLLAGESHFSKSAEITGVNQSDWWKSLFKHAMRNYSLAETEKIIQLLARYDGKIKGMGARPLQQKFLTELALELTYLQSD